MYKTLSAALFLKLALGACVGLAADAGCTSEGGAEFICGLQRPEDLLRVPGTDWVVASGLSGGADKAGHLYAIDVRQKSWKVLYPSDSARARHDKKTYGACPGPLKDSRLGAHGIDLRQKADGTFTLYVVNHIGRESIEVFDLDARRQGLAVTWIGCVVLPAGASANSVAGLPEGGFVTTNFYDPKDPDAFKKMAERKITGSVLEWHADKGWSTVPGSEMSGPNGIAASSDGKWLYVAGWPTKTLTRFARGGAEPKKEVIETGFLTDNLHWSADGSLLAAGQDIDISKALQCRRPECSVPSAAAKVDPGTLKIQRVLSYAGGRSFDSGTTVIEVGDEFWMGSYLGDRVARFQRK